MSKQDALKAIYTSIIISSKMFDQMNSLLDQLRVATIQLNHEETEVCNQKVLQLTEQLQKEQNRRGLLAEKLGCKGIDYFSELIEMTQGKTKDQLSSVIEALKVKAEEGQAKLTLNSTILQQQQEVLNNAIENIHLTIKA
ncbi:hypothetical protein L0B53_13465 [Vibrio sp. SS-MA-C1-2]|uniref:hypothetical protein n=1 Tax=Vibrio sp. SS-MA-C1-2 TaxID=2908646 RepID=UPI001F3DE6C7|nr:hypothetical protein [Vibrio sp. SS-MA-C1-2]UJF18028.1 hypothetical protein L0B53_13465 [Vibrio sp. SS-MA-C1-2]